MKRSDFDTLADRVVRTAALCGGTHGNELTGVTVVRRYLTAYGDHPETGGTVSGGVSVGENAAGRDETFRRGESASPAGDASRRSDSASPAGAASRRSDSASPTGAASRRTDDADRPGNVPFPPPRRPETFTLTALITNPEAVARNRRYIDFDLNRSFGTASLAAPHGGGYERQRAHVLNALLGPKGSPTPETELIIDLHTTTADLGATIIIREDDRLARFIAAWCLREVPGLRVMSYLAEETEVEADAVRKARGDAGSAPPALEGAPSGSDRPASPGTAPGTEPPAGGAPGTADRPGDYPYLAEIAPHGIEVEVGPVPQGVIRGETVLVTERIVDACIAAVDAWNRDDETNLPDTITVYRYTEAVDYPRTAAGEIDGFVHPDRQDRDFAPLQPEDPLFVRLDGSVVPYRGAAGRYPVFINEAAYYEKRAAMTLCVCREITVR